MDCYNCSSQENTYYSEENGFTLVKCSGCGLLYVQNPPGLAEISKAHTQGLHRGEKAIEVTGRYSPTTVRRFSSVLKDLFEDGLDGNIRWLDVGCGHGEFIEALQRFTPHSIQVIGSEPNTHKQESAKSRGLDVRFIDLDSHQATYDYISLLNVYSHLPNPVEFLAKLKELLRPNGELVIETGDTANLPAADHYRPFCLPDHLSFASEKIVTDVLKRLGFEIVLVRKYPFMELTGITFAKEFAKLFVPGYTSRLLPLVSSGKKYSQTDMYIRARRI